MNTAPVDLSNLRAITEGDKDMEKTLFEEFIASFEEGISGLESSLGQDANAAWRTHAHALKGIALNLGAARLGDYCRKAQDDFETEPVAKEALLKQIINEYQQVKEFLLQCI